MTYKVINGKLVKVTYSSKINGYRQTIKVETTKPKTIELPEDKGKFEGSCNIRTCLAPNANWYNRGSLAYYCKSCARMLNRVNRNDPLVLKDGPLCYEGKKKD
jgi:hypothetical protein